jgi:putative phosphoribosyl transferase
VQIYSDRQEAGRDLARRLAHLRGRDLVVLGLPRGGVPVAYEVARALKAPLDVILVRKLGMPLQPELAMGAVGENGVRVLNRDLLAQTEVGEAELAAVERRERAELESRARRLRAGHPPVPLRGRTAVIVDDGIATGSTARAACRVARAHGASRIVLAAPVGPGEVCDRLTDAADEVVCPLTPPGFEAVGQFYRNFRQVGDAEVTALLEEA